MIGLAITVPAGLPYAGEIGVIVEVRGPDGDGTRVSVIGPIGARHPTWAQDVTLTEQEMLAAQMDGVSVYDAAIVRAVFDRERAIRRGDLAQFGSTLHALARAANDLARASAATGRLELVEPLDLVTLARRIAEVRDGLRQLAGGDA